MSKSVKKTPILKENSRGSNKKRKKIANRKLRAKLKEHEYDIANGNAYQKEYESWAISDYKFRMTQEEAIEEYRKWTNPTDMNYRPWIKEQYPTEKDFLRWWRRYYKNK